MTTDANAYDVVAGLNARLANLRVDGCVTLGVERAGGMLDVAATAAALGLPAPADMDDLLQQGRGAELKAVLDALDLRPYAAVMIDADAVRFAPVVTRPGKIVCIGFNYREHAAETGTPIPKAPPVFAKFSNALTGHEGTVTLPTNLDSQFDYETELVMVIGRRCRRVAAADALDHVAGYTIGNDLSARTLQSQTTQFTAGKIADGFAPLGPWLTTRDRVPDPQALTLKTWFDGELRQDWTTSDMIVDCRGIIAFLSGIMTLEPGDVIFTGTPQGVILGEKVPAALRRWIRPGDTVTSAIDGLGELRVHFA